jgi:GAF domain-containing protein
VVATGVLRAEEEHVALLRSIVEVARAIFSARAASIFLLDEERDELVFEAVAGEGDQLVGTRVPSSTGLAGWVLVTGQPLVIDDVTADPRFSREFAETTGYVPRGIMAVPLLHEERTLGVLEVLDRPDKRFTLDQMQLLGLFANQAAIAVDLLRAARRARAVLEEGATDFAVVARLAERLGGLDGESREAAFRLLAALEEVLAQK